MKMTEPPNFDGDEATAVNPAAEPDPVDPDALIMDPVKSDVDLEAGEAPEASPLRVRYNGTANQRILSRSDLSGEPATDTATAAWSPGSDVAWDWFVELAGSEARARYVLGQHGHEFELIGDGSKMPEAEEFSIGGSVEE